MNDDIRMDPQQARQQMNDVVFVDARNPQAWGEADSKLPGAIRIPANALSSNIDKVPKGKRIVTYCT